MATLKTTAPNTWTIPAKTTAATPNLWNKFLAFADTQKSNRTAWFFTMLMVHGILLLPVPAVLCYYFNAPNGILAITMVAFFANLIANMGGAGIRTTITLFAASVLVHLLMILIFVL